MLRRYDVGGCGEVGVVRLGVVRRGEVRWGAMGVEVRKR